MLMQFYFLFKHMHTTAQYDIPPNKHYTVARRLGYETTTQLNERNMVLMAQRDPGQRGWGHGGWWHVSSVIVATVPIVCNQPYVFCYGAGMPSAAFTVLSITWFFLSLIQKTHNSIMCIGKKINFRSPAPMLLVPKIFSFFFFEIRQKICHFH